MNLDQFRRATGISAVLAARWIDTLTVAMQKYDITTPARQAAFLAQIGTESGGFRRLQESFDYNVDGLRATFSTRVTPEQARVLGRHDGEDSVPMDRQIQIANLVYGGRFGNAADEGWKFAGKGLKQITFHDNYLACGKALGLDLIANPNMLLDDHVAALSAGWYWSAHGCAAFADSGDFIGLTKSINGGTNGLADRQARWTLAKSVLIA